MDKRSFYEGKTLTKVEWWLSYCSEFPDFAWARLRVFSDGSADAAFEEWKVYGFDNRESAAFFLAEYEYSLFERMDEEDAIFIGAKLSEINLPDWEEYKDASFIYLGTY